MTKEIVNEKEIDQLLETAVLAMRKGQIENGKSACLQILKRNPKHPHANHLLGIFYVKESNLENAINYMKRVTQLCIGLQEVVELVLIGVI